MKKSIFTFSICMLFLLSACNKKASVKLSTTTYNSGDWVVKGSVKNTSNKMIVGVLSGDPDSNDSQIISINASDDDIPPTIKKGKFSGVISGIGSASYGKKNAKIYLDVVDKDFLDNNDIPEILSKKQIKQIKSEGTKITLKTSKKQIDYWAKLDSNDDVNTDDSDYAENSSTENSTSNNGLTKLTHKVNNGLKNGFAGLNNSKVTIEGQTSIKPYTAGIEIYDKDFMDMAIERNSMVDVLNGIQSFKGYDQYENFNVTYYADLQNDKGKVVKHTKILSFAIEGSQLKQLDPSNMSSKDAKVNVNDYWEQSNIK